MGEALREEQALFISERQRGVVRGQLAGHVGVAGDVVRTLRSRTIPLGTDPGRIAQAEDGGGGRDRHSPPRRFDHRELDGAGAATGNRHEIVLRGRRGTEGGSHQSGLVTLTNFLRRAESLIEDRAVFVRVMAQLAEPGQVFGDDLLPAKLESATTQIVTKRPVHHVSGSSVVA